MVGVGGAQEEESKMPPQFYPCVRGVCDAAELQTWERTGRGGEGVS